MNNSAGPVQVPKPNFELKQTVVSGHTFSISSRYDFSGCRILGRGSYGVVSQAVDVVTKERLAIKRIRPYANDEWDARHTLREIRLMKIMSAHPNIITLYELSLFKEKMELYMVMELMDCDLHHIIQSKQPLTEMHYKCFARQLLEGVKAMHSVGIMHRDLKPGNLLVSKDCQLRITDFGLARFMDEDTMNGHNELNPQTEYVVTRWYRCPELLLSPNIPYTGAIDIWSIGCIMAELIHRKPLFPGKTHTNQVQLIFEVLGFSDVRDLGFPVSAEAASFLNKRCRSAGQDLWDVIPEASEEAVNFISTLLDVNPMRRPTAIQAIDLPYLIDADVLCDYDSVKIVPPTPQMFAFESKKMMLDELKEEIHSEVFATTPRPLPVYYPPTTTTSTTTTTASTTSNLYNTQGNSNPNTTANVQNSGHSSTGTQNRIESVEIEERLRMLKEHDHRQDDALIRQQQQQQTRSHTQQQVSSTNTNTSSTTTSTTQQGYMNGHHSFMSSAMHETKQESVSQEMLASSLPIDDRLPHNSTVAAADYNSNILIQNQNMLTSAAGASGSQSDIPKSIHNSASNSVYSNTSNNGKQRPYVPPVPLHRSNSSTGSQHHFNSNQEYKSGYMPQEEYNQANMTLQAHTNAHMNNMNDTYGQYGGMNEGGSLHASTSQLSMNDKSTATTTATAITTRPSAVFANINNPYSSRKNSPRGGRREEMDEEGFVTARGSEYPIYSTTTGTAVNNSVYNSMSSTLSSTIPSTISVHHNASLHNSGSTLPVSRHTSMSAQDTIPWHASEGSRPIAMSYLAHSQSNGSITNSMHSRHFMDRSALQNGTGITQSGGGGVGRISSHSSSSSLNNFERLDIQDSARSSNLYDDRQATQASDDSILNGHTSGSDQTMSPMTSPGGTTTGNNMLNSSLHSAQQRDVLHTSQKEVGLQSMQEKGMNDLYSLDESREYTYDMMNDETLHDDINTNKIQSSKANITDSSYINNVPRATVSSMRKTSSFENLLKKTSSIDNLLKWTMSSDSIPEARKKVGQEREQEKLYERFSLFSQSSANNIMGINSNNNSSSNSNSNNDNAHSRIDSIQEGGNGNSSSNNNTSSKELNKSRTTTVGGMGRSIFQTLRNTLNLQPSITTTPASTNTSVCTSQENTVRSITTRSSTSFHTNSFHTNSYRSYYSSHDPNQLMEPSETDSHPTTVTSSTITTNASTKSATADTSQKSSIRNSRFQFLTTSSSKNNLTSSANTTTTTTTAGTAANANNSNNMGYSASNSTGSNNNSHNNSTNSSQEHPLSITSEQSGITSASGNSTLSTVSNPIAVSDSQHNTTTANNTNNSTLPLLSRPTIRNVLASLSLTGGQQYTQSHNTTNTSTAISGGGGGNNSAHTHVPFNNIISSSRDSMEECDVTYLNQSNLNNHSSSDNDSSVYNTARSTTSSHPDPLGDYHSDASFYDTMSTSTLGGGMKTAYDRPIPPTQPRKELAHMLTPTAISRKNPRYQAQSSVAMNNNTPTAATSAHPSATNSSHTGLTEETSPTITNIPFLAQSKYHNYYSDSAIYSHGNMTAGSTPSSQLPPPVSMSARPTMPTHYEQDTVLGANHTYHTPYTYTTTAPTNHPTSTHMNNKLYMYTSDQYTTSAEMNSDKRRRKIPLDRIELPKLPSTMTAHHANNSNQYSHQNTVSTQECIHHYPHASIHNSASSQNSHNSNMSSTATSISPSVLKDYLSESTHSDTNIRREDIWNHRHATHYDLLTTNTPISSARTLKPLTNNPNMKGSNNGPQGLNSGHTVNNMYFTRASSNDFYDKDSNMSQDMSSESIDSTSGMHYTTASSVLHGQNYGVVSSNR